MQGKTLPAVIAVMLLVAILLAASNPKPENHLSAIHARLGEKDVVTNVINRGLLALEQPEYHSLVLFSFTKWHERLTSVGVLGYVWVDVSAFK